MSTESSLGEVVYSVDIGVPVQAAWDELTKLGKVQVPMMNTVLECDLEPGAPMRYYNPSRKRILVVGTLMEIEPPHRMVHTYRFTDLDESETLVTWQLDEIPTGVRVTVTHGRFTDQTGTHKRVDGGWAFILKTLKAVLETGKPPLVARLAYGAMSALSFMQPKKTLAENVLRYEERPPGA